MRQAMTAKATTSTEETLMDSRPMGSTNIIEMRMARFSLASTPDLMAIFAKSSTGAPRQKYWIVNTAPSLHAEARLVRSASGPRTSSTMAVWTATRSFAGTARIRDRSVGTKKFGRSILHGQEATATAFERCLRRCLRGWRGLLLLRRLRSVRRIGHRSGDTVSVTYDMGMMRV